MIQYFSMSNEQTHPLHATDKEIIDILRVRLKTLSLRDAVLEVAEITQQPRKKIYNFAIGLKED